MKRWYLVATATILLVVVPALAIDSAVQARALTIAGVCLILWISELVPPFVPTLLLWSLVPLLLGQFDDKFTLPNVLKWAVDPVMALFFGGFVLGIATEKSGLDETFIRLALRSSAGSYKRFLLFVMAITAFLSMWMSNVAAASLVFACLHPVLEKLKGEHILRRALLLGVAFGADFGGIATPIGTGPNAIAIASVSQTQPVSFVSWMIFAFPLTIAVLLITFLYLIWRCRGSENAWAGQVENLTTLERNQPGKSAFRTSGFLIIFTITIGFWLTESVHGIPAAVVALCSAATLFLSSVLSRNDLLKIDWSTLLLIAGGITLGKLLEQSSVVKTIAGHVPFADMNLSLVLFLLCVACASISALMSNTAAAILLIPLASAIMPEPSTAILIAVSASFGVPFLISTPPNAMAFGQGGLKFADLFWPGIVLMIGGCVVVSLTGRTVLNVVEIQ